MDEDPDGNGTAVTLNVRFPGQYYDQETGLHYNYFRYYDPSTGRYLRSDPIGLDGGLNTYLYANANPVKFIDPQGLRGGCPANMMPGPGNSCVFEPGAEDRKECVTAECAAGILPNPNLPPATECEIECNVKWGPACLAAGAGGKAAGGVAGGVAAGGLCNVAKFIACKAACSEDEPEQCPVGDNKRE